MLPHATRRPAPPPPPPPRRARDYVMARVDLRDVAWPPCRAPDRAGRACRPPSPPCDIADTTVSSGMPGRPSADRGRVQGGNRAKTLGTGAIPGTGRRRNPACRDGSAGGGAARARARDHGVYGNRGMRGSVLGAGEAGGEGGRETYRLRCGLAGGDSWRQLAWEGKRLLRAAHRPRMSRVRRPAGRPTGRACPRRRAAGRYAHGAPGDPARHGADGTSKRTPAGNPPDGHGQGHRNYAPTPPPPTPPMLLCRTTLPKIPADIKRASRHASPQALKSSRMGYTTEQPMPIP